MNDLETATRNRAKTSAAARALEFVRDGMKLGLGSGSTAAFFVALLGERIERESLRIVSVPTSKATESLARQAGIPLATLEETGQLDLTVDGADEFDGSLNLIKGGGGAHLREKVIAWASRRMIVIADAEKQVATLGKFPLPIEVVQFGHRAVAEELASWEAPFHCGPPRRRLSKSGEPFVTDEGNYILDCPFGSIADPAALAARLDALPGVMAHGLFVGIAELAIVGDERGDADQATIIQRPTPLANR